MHLLTDCELSALVPNLLAVLHAGELAVAEFRDPAPDAAPPTRMVRPTISCPGPSGRRAFEARS